MPTHWVIPASALSDEAPIHFRFPKPIEGYSGKVTKMHGGMRLGDGHSLADARGWFNVDVKNVTLGEDALDESVRNNVEFLYSSAFPLSWFELQSIDTTSSALKPEKPVEGFLVGYFTLKDSSVPLRARARLFLHRSASNQWCLDLCAEFELKQLREVFHISGPGGESEPAGNHMFFEVKTTLIPVAPHTYNELLGL